MTEKTISHSTYLQALGLYTLAHGYSRKAEEVNRELAALLGLDDDYGHVGDAVFAGEEGGPHALDEALRREGIGVAAPTPPSTAPSAEGTEEQPR